MKLLMSMALSLLMLLSASTALAEQRIVEADGSYVMDSRLDETPASATARAREDAKRNAVEKAGVYVKSYTKVIDLELTEDEINTVAAQFLQVLEEKSSVAVVRENLLEFTVHIKALVDDSDPARLRSMMEDRQQLEVMAAQNRELQAKYDELKKQMESLSRDYDSASSSQRKEIKRAAAANDESFKAMQELEAGNAHYLRGDYEQALASYNRAIELDGRSADAYDNRGLTYYHLNRLSDAIADFNRAIELNSSFAYAFNNRGLARHALGNADDALNDYSRALTLNPKFAAALNNRANAYFALEQYGNAENDLNAALSIDRTNAAAHNNLGSVYFATDRFDEALREYSEALRLKSNYAEAYYNRGCVYYRQGRYAEALSDARQAAALEPGDTAFRDLVARSNAKLGR